MNSRPPCHELAAAEQNGRVQLEDGGIHIIADYARVESPYEKVRLFARDVDLPMLIAASPAPTLTVVFIAHEELFLERSTTAFFYSTPIISIVFTLVAVLLSSILSVCVQCRAYLLWWKST